MRKINKFKRALLLHYAIIATGTIILLGIHFSGGNVKHIVPYSLFCFVLITVISVLICTAIFTKMKKL